MTDEDNTEVSTGTSTELTGGVGYTFEDSVVTFYLAGLLCEGQAGALPGVVKRVAVQQSSAGLPLDDVIVNTRDEVGERQLSLQVKRSLTISAAASNEDFRQIIIDCRATRACGTFQVGRDAYGFVAQEVAALPLRSLKRILEHAKASTTALEFSQRFQGRGATSQPQRSMREKLRSLVAESDAAEWDFYKHFVIPDLAGLEDGGALASIVASNLNTILMPGDGPAGMVLFTFLCRTARIGAGSGSIWTRPVLLNQLSADFLLRGIPAYADDIAIINRITSTALAEISDQVGTMHVDRSASVDKAFSLLEKHRLVNITGLPGCGKSAILRNTAKRMGTGTVLFLKSDLLVGTDWQEYTVAKGIAHRDPVDLLAEIGSTGNNILFIDGVDRVAPPQRAIIKNLMHAIICEQSLDSWRVLVTSRSQGMEPFRVWLPTALYSNSGIGDLSVDAFNDAEAELVADKFPFLRSLLFGAEAIRSIARRPFYTAVLAARGGCGVESSDSQSETDLIRYWWGGGGYDSHGETLIVRQRALLDLAEVGGRSLGKSVSSYLLKPETAVRLSELIDDGIVRTSDEHATYSFTHDIYFEWAYYRLLRALGEDWPDALISAGQPPLLGRVVSLLAQQSIELGSNWNRGIARLSEPGLRAQWLRCWVTGPLASPRFVEHKDRFVLVMAENDWVFLRKFLVWFQATNTIPNPGVLESSRLTLEAGVRVQLADMTGLPADLKTWFRVLDWLFSVLDKLPDTFRLLILELFKVWQNVFAATPNILSEKIVCICALWLEQLDDVEYPKEDSFGIDLRRLVLQAISAYPSAGNAVLDRTVGSKQLRSSTYETVIGLSWCVAPVSPERLADLACAELLEKLPIDELLEQREEQKRRSENFKKNHSKSHAERSEGEGRPPHFRSLSSHVRAKDYSLRELAVPRHHRSCFPQSPLQEPFSTLFRTNPDTARALVRDIGNHATTAWKQIHEIKKQALGSPIALEIDFPWGVQSFWGDSSNYNWISGTGGGAMPIDCAFMALAYWAHKELELGVDIDELIQKVVEGHDSVAVLNLAISLSLEGHQASSTTFPLATSIRVWELDIARRVQEPMRGIDLLGISSLTRPKGDKGESLDYLESRPSRYRDIRNLALLFAMSTNVEMRERFRIRLEKFPSELPFEYEEDRADKGAEAYLREHAVHWAGLGNANNYRTLAIPDSKRSAITYESPIPVTEAELRRSAEASLSLKDHAVCTWANNSLRDNEFDTSDTLESCTAFVKTRDRADLFDHLSRAGGGMTQSAVSGVAASILLLGNTTHDSAWAIDVMCRVKTMPEGADSFGVSNMPWHPVFHVIAVLKAELQAVEKQLKASNDLLNLCVHTNDGISEAAFSVLLNCADTDIAWNAMVLATDLCHQHEPVYRRGGGCDDSAEQEAIANAVSRAIARLTSGEIAYPAPLPNPHPKQRAGSSSPFDEEAVDDEHESIVIFNYDDCSRLVRKIRNNAFFISPKYHGLFQSYVKDLVAWTASRFNPTRTINPTGISIRSDRTRLNEWPQHLGELLARTSPYIDYATMKAELLGPFLKPDDENGLEVTSAFVKSTVVIHVIDANEIMPHTLSLLEGCLEQLLASRTLRRGSVRAGKLDGYSERPMAKSLLFIPLDDEALGASRFANGDWTSLPTVLPIIDKFVGTAGWSPDVISLYLDMVERAGVAYPIDSFTKLITKVLSELGGERDSWIGKTITARIAGVMQVMADSSYPLSSERATALLKPIDMLIDLGDRRAAALEESETFRSAQTS